MVVTFDPQPTATPTVTPTATPTNTPTNTPMPLTATPTFTETPTATPTNTNTPVPPTATPTATATNTNTPMPPTGTLIGVCGPYTVYKVGNTYTTAGWAGTILVGTNGNNTLNGTNGADLLLGLGGNDKLDGKGGDDLICGGDGVDLLTGAAGNDLLDGGGGDYDTLLAGDGNDILLDRDGVISAQGGPGNDVFTIALRKGWHDPQGEPRFTGLAAGFGNDAVGLAILGSPRLYLEISGDEPGSTPNPLDGTQDTLVFTGRIESNSQIVKFERGVVLAANVADAEPTSFEGFLVDPTTLTDESGTEFLSEPVGGDEPVEEDGSADGVANQVFLPIVMR